MSSFGIPAQLLFLGVDGGGTGCRAAMCRADGTRIGQATGGPANVSTDFDTAVDNIAKTVTAASLGAGLRDADMRRVVAHLGIAGVVSDRIAARVAARLDLGDCRVTDDRPTTVAGALGDGDGAVVSLGTGSFVGARRGMALRAVGGWGLPVSDQASAAWIGRAALTATLDAVDGLTAPSPLTDAILARFNHAPQAIVTFSAGAQPMDYGTMAPTVTAAALDGDATAVAILQAGAAWIERALVAVGHDDALPLCLMGGVAPAMQPYLMRAGRQIVAPVGTALDGAVQLARRRVPLP